jgi:hypothetical protein
MRLGKLRGILVTSTAGVLVGGTVLYASARSGQTQEGKARPEGRHAEAGVELKRRIETPAPRSLKVESGHGKIIIYELDNNGERVPEGPEVERGRFRETQREVHWAVVTGVIDHHKVQKSLIVAHRQPLPPAERLYCRVELERQTLEKDGSWSHWRSLDIEAILRILDNVPAIEEERVAPEYRVEALVDPLPFLPSGKWRGVDVDEFVPPERKEPLDGRRDRPPVLMVRSLDFTVEPGRTYRYRARVVLFNPHYDRRKPGDHKLIFGPWSEATDIVTVPGPDGKP